jgi:hypothetical protein
MPHASPLPDTARLSTEDRADLRAALLDQLRYLIDEVERLKAVVDRVPEPVQEGKPLPSDLSMKETFGLLATLDRTVHRPRLAHLEAHPDGAGPDAPAFDAADPDALVADNAWNDASMTALLEQVQASRRALLDAFDRVTDWTLAFTIGGETHDVFAYARAVAQSDFEHLRALALRLHDANLGA